MKGFLKFAMMMLAFVAFGYLVQSFVPGNPGTPADKYVYGYRTAVTATLTDTVNLEIEPNNFTQMLVTASIDTNIVVTADDDNSIANDLLIVKLTADASNRQVDWSTNFTAVDDSVIATKTKTFTFVYDGSNFIQVAEIQDN